MSKDYLMKPVVSVFRRFFKKGLSSKYLVIRRLTIAIGLGSNLITWPLQLIDCIIGWVRKDDNDFDNEQFKQSLRNVKSIWQNK